MTHYHVMPEGDFGPKGQMGGQAFWKFEDAIVEFGLYCIGAYKLAELAEHAQRSFSRGNAGVLRRAEDGSAIAYVAKCTIPECAPSG